MKTKLGAELFQKYKKHSNYSRYLLVTRAYLRQLVIHNTACGQLQSSQICPVWKDSGDAGWEPAGHMAKPRPGKTKEILKSLPAHCPPLKMSIVLLPCPVTDLLRGTSLRVLTLKCIALKKKKLTASRYVKRDSVESTATDFKQAPLLFLIKAKRMSQFTHVKDHRRFFCLYFPLICTSIHSHLALSTSKGK